MATRSPPQMEDSCSDVQPSRLLQPTNPNWSSGDDGTTAYDRPTRHRMNYVLQVAGEPQNCVAHTEMKPGIRFQDLPRRGASPFSFPLQPSVQTASGCILLRRSGKRSNIPFRMTSYFELMKLRSRRDRTPGPPDATVIVRPTSVLLPTATLARSTRSDEDASFRHVRPIP